MNPDITKMAENRIHPASVTQEPEDARSFQSVAFNAVAASDRFDEVAVELVAISDPPFRFSRSEMLPL